MSNEKQILGSLFEQQPGGGKDGGANQARTIALWQRMAGSLDAVAANTRGRTQNVVGGAKDYLKETASSKQAQEFVGRGLMGPAYDALRDVKALLPEWTGVATRFKKNQDAEAKKIAAEKADNKKRAAKRDSFGRFVGPTAKARSRAENLATPAVSQSVGGKGRFATYSPESRRIDNLAEISAESLNIQWDEAKEDRKRHKELVKTIAANKRGMMDRFLDRGIMGRRLGGGANVGRTRDVAVGRRGAKPANVAKAGKSGLLGRLFGGTSKKLGAGAAALGGTALLASEALSDNGKLARGAAGPKPKGNLVSQAGRGVGRGLLNAGKFGLRALGPLAALAFAGYDAFQGWNDKGLHAQAFGLKEGQEATTGQKFSAATASVLDMGGLTTGLLNLLGVDIDTADIARGIHNLGTSIANFAPAMLEEAKAGLSRLWEGAKDIGNNLMNMASSAWDKAGELLSSVWTGAGNLASDLWSGIGSMGASAWEGVENFAQSAWSGASGMISSVWGNITGAADAAVNGMGEFISNAWSGAQEAASKLWGSVQNLASSALDGAGKLLSEGWEKFQSTSVGKAATSLWDKGKSWLFGSDKPATPQTPPVQEATAPKPENYVLPAVDTTSSNALLQSQQERTQQELNDTLAKLNKNIEEECKLLREEQMQALDPFGIGIGMANAAEAIRNVRAGGSSFMGGGSGGGGSGPGGRKAFAYNPNAKIGETIAHFESGNKGVSAVAWDKTGGTSYGKFQLSSKQANGGEGSMQAYLRWMQSQGGEKQAIAERLMAAGPANTGGKTGAFVDQYNKEVAANAKLLEDTQHEFMVTRHYNPALKGLKSDSLRQMVEGDRSLQEALFSFAVQHGPGTGDYSGAGASNIWNKVYREGMSREDFLRAVYEERKSRFSSSTPDVQASVRARFNKELQLILGMNKGEENVRQMQARMQAGGMEAVQAGTSHLIATATQDAMDRGVGYKLGAKNSDAGEIDCSGWVQELGNRYMAQINTAMGSEVFSSEARRAFNRGANNQGAAGIIQAVSQYTGELLTNERLAPEMAREGMVIGLDTGPKRWDGGMFKGIDHVVQTFRDPVTGELMVSESRGSKGVMTSRYDEWYAQQQKRGARLYGADITKMADASLAKPTAQPAPAETAAATATPALNPMAVARGDAALATPSVPAHGDLVPQQRPEQVAQILPPEAQAPGNNTLNMERSMANVEKLLADMLSALQTVVQNTGNLGKLGMETPNISTDFNDKTAAQVARS